MSPVIKPVCKDCSERHLGCHDKCEKYLKAKEEYWEKKSAIYQEKKEHSEYMTSIMRKKR